MLSLLLIKPIVEKFEKEYFVLKLIVLLEFFTAKELCFQNKLN